MSAFEEYTLTAEALKEFQNGAYKRGLAAGIAQERERCARVAEEFLHGDGFPSLAASKIAAAIRAGEASE